MPTAAGPPDANSAGEVNTLPPEVSKAAVFQERSPRYQLRAGDSLQIDFAFTPEFNQTLAVQPDGFVTLKEVGDLQVQGRTVPELRQMIRTAYADILHEPVVSITLKEFEAPYFTAGGELARPGKFDLRGHTTLTEAVTIAGGFRDSAKHSQVLLFRRVSDQWVQVRKFDVKRMLSSGNLQEDPTLHPGDMVYVPKNSLSKIKDWIRMPSMSLNPAQF
jgi:polysaccharide export outer membrane protein